MSTLQYSLGSIGKVAIETQDTATSLKITLGTLTNGETDVKTTVNNIKTTSDYIYTIVKDIDIDTSDIDNISSKIDTIISDINTIKITSNNIYALSNSIYTSNNDIYTMVDDLKSKFTSGGSEDIQILNAMSGDTYFDVEFIDANINENTIPYYQVSGKLRSFDFVGYLGTYKINNGSITNITKITQQITSPDLLFINGTKIFNTSIMYPYYIYPYAVNQDNTTFGHTANIGETDGHYIMRLHSKNTITYGSSSEAIYYCIILEKSTFDSATVYSYNVFENKFVNSSLYGSGAILSMYKFIHNDVYYITAGSNIYEFNDNVIDNLVCANDKSLRYTEVQM